MKLILTEHPNNVEIVLQGADGYRIACYVFDTKRLAEAFCSGFSCAKQAANGLVQSLPMGYETPITKPETLSQQLSRQWVGRA
jgi:hypothetical protein